MPWRCFRNQLFLRGDQGVFLLDTDVVSRENLIEIYPILATPLTQERGLLRWLNDLFEFLGHLYWLIWLIFSNLGWLSRGLWCEVVYHLVLLTSQQVLTHLLNIRLNNWSHYLIFILTQAFKFLLNKLTKCQHIKVLLF